MSKWTYTITHCDDAPIGAICFGIAAAAAPGASASIKAQRCTRQGAVCYRVRAVDESTGELRESWACTAHACWLSHSARLPWLGASPAKVSA